MKDWLNQCHFGDVRDVLKLMIADGVKVNTIVTSPPYWGLRSYLPADHPDKAHELGSEPTIQEFIASMTEVFMLAREVLADDGTLFLNMGDSYFSGGGKQVTNSSDAATRRGPQPSVRRATSCGTSDKEPASSPSSDCLCGNLCDACRAAYRIGKSHSSGQHVPTPTLLPSLSSRVHRASMHDHPPTSDSIHQADRTSPATTDQQHSSLQQDAELRGALESTNPESSLQLPGACLQVSPQAVLCQLCACSLPDCVQGSERMASCSHCTALRGSVSDIEGKGVLASAYPYSTNASLKPKDLVGQPWRLAFALQDAGWWLRQDIIWSKPNPMPESARDRCTKAHEYLFLLAKSERYYYDFDAVQEPVNGGANARRSKTGVGFGHGFDENPKPRVTAVVPTGWDTRTGEGGHGAFHKLGRTPGNVNPPKGQAAYEAGDESHRTKGGLLAHARKLAAAGSGTKNNGSMDAALEEMRSTRNRRSVWTVGSEPYKGAHFATFPRALIEPCILAGAGAGGTVLDIFMGSGTTAQVAEKLGRKWIGIDFDIRNKALQDERLRQPSLDLEAA